MKLGLGTVQFGLDYGVSNKDGKVPYNEIQKIIDFAQQKNIQVLDTAHAYGSSETVLGSVLPEKNNFDIVTKTPQCAPILTKHDAQLLEDSFIQSLARLRKTTIYGLLVHNADDLLKTDAIRLWEKMVEFKERGMVKKIGVSVYTRHQLEAILDMYTPDLVQLPINIFDQTFYTLLPALKRQGIEIHARSVFLQGLLLMNLNELPPYFEPIRQHIEQYHIYITNHGLSPLQAALRFCDDISELDVVLVGVCSVEQLAQIWQACNDTTEGKIDFAHCAVTDEKIIKPSLWNLQ